MTGTDAASSAPVAGWYHDPAGRFALRLWDGSDWTDQVADSEGVFGHDPLVVAAPDDVSVPSTPDASSSAPAPGWYADPTAENQVRWWDGTQWAADVGATGSSTPPPHEGPSRSIRVKVGAGVAAALLVGGLLAVALNSSSSGSSPRSTTNQSVSTVASTPSTAKTPPPITVTSTASLSGAYASTVGYPPGCSTAQPTPITARVVVDQSAGSVSFDLHSGSLIVAKLTGLAFSMFDPSVNTTYTGGFDTSGPAPTFHLEGRMSDDPCQAQVVNGTKVSD